MLTVVCIITGLFLVFVSMQIFIRKAIVERGSGDSFATLPGRLKPNRWRLRALSPGLYPYYWSWRIHWDHLRLRIFYARILWYGASNPAVVVHQNPLIIAAYAADCDAVLLVRFLPEFVEEVRERGYNLQIGAHFLSINTYFRIGENYDDDEINLGARNTGIWSSFRPLIAEFICDDSVAIETRKTQIPAELWERARHLGVEKLKVSTLDEVRWGNPMYADTPRSYLDAIAYAEQWNLDY